MARTTIAWGDGSGDNIYLDYSAASGDQTVAVSSDANAGAARSKSITFSASGASPVVLSVEQAAGALPDNYVRDGLVLWLDGINKGENSGAWTDLIGGLVFQADGAVSVEKGWETGSGKKLIYASALGFGYSTCTIEVVITRQGPMVTQIDAFSSLGSNDITLSFDGLYIYMAHQNAMGTRINCTAPSASASGKYCMSVIKGRAIVNGTSYNVQSSASVGNANYTAVGSRGNGNYYMTGIVHSVRIYNRQLTESEMKYNQAIDNVRFALGLNL